MVAVVFAAVSNVSREVVARASPGRRARTHPGVAEHPRGVSMGCLEGLSGNFFLRPGWLPFIALERRSRTFGDVHRRCCARRDRMRHAKCRCHENHL